MFRLLLLLAVVAVGAHAKASMWKLEVQVVKVPAAHAGLAGCRVHEGRDWAEHLRAGHVQVLESGSVIGTLNKDSLSHTGGKIPIGFRDPRADSYQVQYIDTGFKIDAKVSESKPGLLEVEVRTEHAALTGDTAAGLPEQDVMTFNSVALLKPGQVAVMGTVRGRISSPYVKKILPKAALAEGDSIMFVVAVSQP